MTLPQAVLMGVGFAFGCKILEGVVKVLGWLFIGMAAAICVLWSDIETDGELR